MVPSVDPALRRRQMVQMAAYLFLVTATFGFIQPFLALYLAAAGFTNAQIGVMTGVGSGLALLIQPVLGRWSDRADARRPFIAVIAASAGLAYAAIPFAKTFPQFLALVTIGTNATLFLNSAGAILIGRLVRGRTEGGGLYAQLRVWGTFGYLTVALISGLSTGGLRPLAQSREQLDMIFRFGPILFLMIAVFAWWLPDRKNEGSVIGGRFVSSPNLRRFLVSYFLFFFTLYGATNYLGIFIGKLGGSPLVVSLAFAAGAVVELFIMRKAGAWSDQFGRRPALLLSFGLLPLRMALYAAAVAPWNVILIQSLHGINFGITGAVAIAFANDLAEEGKHGQAQSRLSAAIGLAGALGPVTFGQVADWLGLRNMFLMSGAVAFVGFLWFFLTVEDSHRESSALAERGPAWLRPLLRWLDRPFPSRNQT